MINNDFLNKILSIDWFSNCGNLIKQEIKLYVTYVDRIG